MPLEWNLYLYLFTNINFLIMNKKFSTLMDSLMLASAFSVSAQVGHPIGVDKYEDGKYYVLEDNNNNVLSVVYKAGSNYGELTMTWVGNKPDYWNLNTTRSALWKVTVVPGKAGDAPDARLHPHELPREERTEGAEHHAVPTVQRGKMRAQKVISATIRSLMK